MQRAAGALGPGSLTGPGALPTGMTTDLRLSILDLAVVRQGEPIGDALRASIALAQQAEASDRFERIWFAEHHNMPRIASAATAVVVGAVAAATERIRVGIPATAVQTSSSGAGPSGGASGGGGAGGNNAGGTPAVGASLIVEATQDFITFLDALRLGLVAKDQLHPLLTDVIQSANKVTGGADFENRGKIVQWLITLNQMKATDELTEAQTREVELDINSAYQGFKKILS